jgi:drug/metabolite transporter (DMT)-like permease
MFISGIFTALILLITSLIFEEHLIPQAITSILVLFLLGFICQFLGQSFITHSLAFLPVSSSSLTLLIQPIVATILGYLFFQEKLNLIQFLGSGLILIGIYLAQITNDK